MTILDDLDRGLAQYRKAHPFKHFYDSNIYHIKEWLNPRNWYHSIRNFYLRGRYGWCPRDVWSFDTYLSQVIADGLDHLRKNHMGIPVSSACKIHSDTTPAEMTDNEWCNILQQISDGMRAHMKICDLDYSDYINPNSTELKQLQNKEQTAFRLLSSYFGNLWD